MTVVSVPGSPRPVTPASILAGTLERLSRQAAAGDRIDPEWLSQLDEASRLAAGLDDYLSRYSTPASPALDRLAERTAAEDWNRHAGPASPGGSAPLEQEMLSGHVEGQVLKMLVRATGARRVLEIGMFTGYSALAMAEALPAGGQIVACEIDQQVADFAQRCFADSPDGAKIAVRVGPAQATLAQLCAEGDRFDLVFIDADKAGYAGYLDTLLETGLLALNALICVDNTLMQGRPWLPGEPTPNAAAIIAFNERVAADPRVEQVIIPLRDGLTLIRPVPSEIPCTREP